MDMGTLAALLSIAVVLGVIGAYLALDRRLERRQDQLRERYGSLDLFEVRYNSDLGVEGSPAVPVMPAVTDGDWGLRFARSSSTVGQVRSRYRVQHGPGWRLVVLSRTLNLVASAVALVPIILAILSLLVGQPQQALLYAVAGLILTALKSALQPLIVRWFTSAADALAQRLQVQASVSH